MEDNQKSIISKSTSSKTILLMACYFRLERTENEPDLISAYFKIIKKQASLGFLILKILLIDFYRCRRTTFLIPGTNQRNRVLHNKPKADLYYDYTVNNT